MKTKLIVFTLFILIAASCKTTPSTVANQIVMTGLIFSPNTLTVSIGTTVTWVNNESAIHTVTSDTGLFDSGDLTISKTFSYTFSKAGTFAFHCKHHSSMTGNIIVQTNSNTGTVYLP